MKAKNTIVLLIAGAWFVFAGVAVHAAEVSVNSMPASVLKTVPQAGDTRVDPALKEIRVTFSKDMITDRSWSVVQISPETFPKIEGEIRYADKRTCVIPVKLEPGKTYVLWFNQGNFNNFRDAGGRPAVPYLLVFQTTR